MQESETQKIRIMFVDDDPMLLASTRRQLSRKLSDCELVFFERATDALEDIANCPPAIVLSDVRMPEMDGAEFLERVAAQRPETIRLAWTGQSEADQLVRVFDIAHQTFSKPCPTELLHSLISTLADFARQHGASNCNNQEELRDCLSRFEEIFIFPPVNRE